MLNIENLLDRLNENSEEKLTMADLGKSLFPDSSHRMQGTNISRLNTGFSKSVKIEHVHQLCEILKCSKDELFEIKKD